jgi:hypothetical protein
MNTFYRQINIINISVSCLVKRYNCILCPSILANDSLGYELSRNVCHSASYHMFSIYLSVIRDQLTELLGGLQYIVCMKTFI